jgi:pyrroloquinoline-quinone synthase
VSGAAWSREEFEGQLRSLGSKYHIHHPFNRLMASGAANAAQLRGWVANRFYYQTNIPIKDAAILANCPDRAVRRSWVQRILDHDGYGDDAGGIESWLRLAEAVGLSRERTESLDDVLPGVRFAVDAYVNFARRAPYPILGSTLRDCTTFRAGSVSRAAMSNSVWLSRSSASTRARCSCARSTS